MSHGLLNLRKLDFSCHTLEYENIMIQNNISQEMFAKFVVWNIGGNIFEQISNIFCQTIRGTVQNLFTNFLHRGGRYPKEFSFSVSFILIILVLVIPLSEREELIQKLRKVLGAQAKLKIGICIASTQYQVQMVCLKPNNTKLKTNIAQNIWTFRIVNKKFM